MNPMRKVRIAIIGGSGMKAQFQVGGSRVVSTEYGRTVVYESSTGERQFFFLARHGMEQEIPPHAINYRANIAGLHELGVEKIIATNAVGSMRKDFRVGELGILEQFIDFTRGRSFTFFNNRVVHTDMTEPYDKDLRHRIELAAQGLGIRIKTGLVYVCVDGPRYESPAEIKMFRLVGGDIVGMTGVPEVSLSKELGMKYASIAVATNWAAGIQQKVSHEEVISVMKKSGNKVRKLIDEIIKNL